MEKEQAHLKADSSWLFCSQDGRIRGRKGKMLEFVPSYGLLAAPADCHADCSPFYKDFHRQHLLKKSEHSFAEEPFVPTGMIVLR